MQLKVDVADVRPDTDAPKQRKVTNARAHMPAGTRAAARIDALMGADSRRAAERKNFTAAAVVVVWVRFRRGRRRADDGG